MNTAAIAAVENRPPDLFVTRAMLHRRKAAPNLQAEAEAFCELSKILAGDPCVALRHLLDIARSSCHAGSAGLSLLRDDGAGGTIVRWAAISGALASYEGTDTPRDSSPCGSVWIPARRSAYHDRSVRSPPCAIPSLRWSKT